jgi:hypothetical protein
MKFSDIFKDSNDINEKSVVGFIAFAVMIIFAIADLTTGYFGKHLVISDLIYNSFQLLVLGCFGISGIEKILVNRKKEE